MKVMKKVMPVTVLLLSAIFVPVPLAAAECLFEGRYEQPGWNGEKHVAVVQGDMVIFAHQDVEGRLIGTVRPHRIRDRNPTQCSFSASTLTLDDDSGWPSPAGGLMPATQVYRMEGRVLNTGGQGLFFPSTI